MPHPVIKVITDSTSDIPSAWAAKWDITIVPLTITVGNKSFLDDGVQVQRSEFYKRMSTLKDFPTTSASPLGLTRDLIASKAAEADHLILITLPIVFSATNDNFRLAAEDVAPGRYTLIDSGQLSMGIGWLALAAAEAAHAGASVEDVQAIVADTKERIRTFVIVSSLENLRRSGRVSWSSAMAANLLKIKPMIELRDGDPVLLERVRAFKRAYKKLAQLGREHAPFERLAVLHANNLEGAQTVVNELADVFTPDQAFIAEATPVIGIHLGVHSVGIAFVKQAQATQ